jgi:hypothetical protein
MDEKFKKELIQILDEVFEKKFIPLFNQGFEEVISPQLEELFEGQEGIKKQIARLATKEEMKSGFERVERRLDDLAERQGRSETQIKKLESGKILA